MTDDPRRHRRPRRLNEAERTLWREVTRGIAPIRPRPTAEEAEVAERMPTKPPGQSRKPGPSTAAAAPTSVLPRRTPPLAPLGRKMRQRIARGSHALDSRIDLHGLTQREAHDALLGFLRTAQQRGATIVLVITGKGTSREDAENTRGVLRRQVPHWLRLSVFREIIVGFEPAHMAHGGEGALYVRLRRKRDAR